MAETLAFDHSPRRDDDRSFVSPRVVGAITVVKNFSERLVIERGRAFSHGIILYVSNEKTFRSIPFYRPSKRNVPFLYAPSLRRDKRNCQRNPSPPCIKFLDRSNLDASSFDYGPLKRRFSLHIVYSREIMLFLIFIRI